MDDDHIHAIYVNDGHMGETCVNDYMYIYIYIYIYMTYSVWWSYTNEIYVNGYQIGETYINSDHMYDIQWMMIIYEWNTCELWSYGLNICKWCSYIGNTCEWWSYVWYTVDDDHIYIYIYMTYSVWWSHTWHIVYDDHMGETYVNGDHIHAIYVSGDQYMWASLLHAYHK